MAEQKQKPKLFFEIFHEEFQRWAVETIGKIPELRSLVIVPDFVVGNKELVPCQIVTNVNKSLQSLAHLNQLVIGAQFNLLQQLHNMLEELRSELKKAEVDLPPDVKLPGKVINEQRTEGEVGS